MTSGSVLPVAPPRVQLPPLPRDRHHDIGGDVPNPLLRAVRQRHLEQLVQSPFGFLVSFHDLTPTEGEAPGHVVIFGVANGGVKRRARADVCVIP